MSDSLSYSLDFSPGSANATALQARLGPKLLETGYAQEDLLGNFCEFITIMIGNAKTKDQINTELSELIGDDFNPAFTDWLFDQIDQISHQNNNNTNDFQDESMEDQPHHTEPTTSPFRRGLKGTPTSARSAAAPYPQTSRMVDQINRTLERATTQIKHTIPDLPNVPTGPRSQSSAGPIRRGGRVGIGGRPPVPVPPMAPNFGAFMMANGVPPEVLQQMMVDAANFPNQILPGFPVMTLADRISDMDGSNGIVVAGGEKARCRHWPRCQLGARCKFHHPSQICPYSLSSSGTNQSDFPNCPNLAGTCPNIHVGVDIPESEVNTVVTQQLRGGIPANGHNKQPHKVNGHTPRRESQPVKPVKPQEPVPLCKFAAGCTKPDCPFAHPTPAAGQDGLVLRGEMCPEGRNCQNRECDMGHPSPAVEGVKRKEAENCKFFPNCANPDCPYKHPAVSVSKALSIPCKFGVNCTRPNCIYNHEIAIPCRYHPCLNEQCLFKHTEGQQPNKNKVWTSDSNGSTMDRKFAYDNAEERIVVGSGLHGHGGDTVVHE